MANLDSTAGNDDQSVLHVVFCENVDTIRQAIKRFIKQSWCVNDILHDTFIEAIEKIKRGIHKEKEAMASWLLMIARNLCKDYLRIQHHDPLSNSVPLNLC